MKGSGRVEYSFSDTEIKRLALLLRDSTAAADTELDIFRCFLEKYIYEIMTIEEAEVFFNEKTVRS